MIGRGRTISRDDRGTVTAELAIVLPAVTAILAVLLAGAAAGLTQLRVQEGARAGARAAARGEAIASVQEISARITGPGAAVQVSYDGPWIRVRVSAAVDGPLGRLVDWPLTARAVALREPGGAGPAAGAPP